MADISALTVHPGAVVVADFPGVMGVKRRPAVVVSTDVYHAARPDAILGLLTGQVAAAVASTDYRLHDGAAAGLHAPTAFRAFFITLPREDIIAVIGHLSDLDWKEVQARIRLAIACGTAAQ
jgi:mRNA interferase MazF